MSTPDSDQALVDGLRAGDRAAFERLYDEYHSAIYNLCARILGDREEAKDVTQDVFIKAYHSPPAAVRGAVRVRPWLYRVATNACFNHLRRRGRLGGDQAAIDAAQAPVDEYERAQTVALVERSLSGLNERYRTALVLKDLHGLPADEIAEAMGVSRPTADVLVHRARAAFRSAFTTLSAEAGTAPASLGLVLTPLAVPPALQVPPPLPAPLGGTPHPPATGEPGASAPHPLPLPDASSSVGPAGAGLLTKIGAALSTKVGITAAVATLAVGGGAAVYTADTRDDHRGVAVPRQQTFPGVGTHETLHGSSHHETRWRAAAHTQDHGPRDSAHAGLRDADDGAHDPAHVGRTTDGGADASAHGSGDAGADTTHDAGTTTSPTHDVKGDTSDTHDPDGG